MAQGNPCYRLPPPAFFSTKPSPCSTRRWATRCWAKDGGVCLRLRGSRPRTWTPWASAPTGGPAGGVGKPEESGGARGPRPAPGPRSGGQAAGTAVGDSSACGSRARLPAAGLPGVAGGAAAAAARVYEEKQRLGKPGAASWNLIYSPVMRLRPFRMAAEEGRAARAAFGLVQPQLRYRHVSLERSAREMGVALRLA